jgi:DNA-binding NtrC family response regulator
VIDLTLPPLRERQGDVPLLMEHFLRKHWRRPEERPRWTARAERALLSYAWPGNVRELESTVERACVLTRGSELDLDLLPAEVAGAAPDPAAEPVFPELTATALSQAREAAVYAVERRFLAELMQQCEGNVSRAAREAGFYRGNLQKLLAQHRGTGKP